MGPNTPIASRPPKGRPRKQPPPPTSTAQLTPPPDPPVESVVNNDIARENLTQPANASNVNNQPEAPNSNDVTGEIDTDESESIQTRPRRTNMGVPPKRFADFQLYSTMWPENNIIQVH